MMAFRPLPHGQPSLMPRAQLVSTLLVSGLLLGGGATAAQDAGPDGAPMVVTTDTRAYCLTLSAQIETYRSMPREVRDLQVEGRALCGEGYVRKGINRLRRALMVLHDARTPSDEPTVAHE